MLKVCLAIALAGAGPGGEMLNFHLGTIFFFVGSYYGVKINVQPIKGAYDAGIRIHPGGHISDLCKHNHTTLGADTPEHHVFCPLLPECSGRRLEDEAVLELRMMA